MGHRIWRALQISQWEWECGRAQQLFSIRRDLAIEEIQRKNFKIQFTQYAPILPVH
jgi:hypothetical protein